MICKSLNSKLLDQGNQDVVIIDVNSLFLFTNSPSKSLYEFINKIKAIKQNNNILFINVIDNGLNRKMARRYPDYKSNRIVSKETHYLGLNKQDKNNKFKCNIDKIHQIDKHYNNHLTFYTTGESDFKIGYILKWIYQNTLISSDHILTVANDKDFILTSTMSNVLLKRKRSGDMLQYFFKNTDQYLLEFKEIFKLESLLMNKISDYYYYLLLNGDSIDHIKSILTHGQTIDFLNQLYNKYNMYNLNLICQHIRNIKDDVTINDINENVYLIDIYNEKTFTNGQITSMNLLLDTFFKRNHISLL